MITVESYVSGNNFYIYKLVCPITNKPEYIGITKDCKTRYRKHLNEKSITLKNNWIKSLLKKGLKPLMVVFDSRETREEINNLERYWIAKFKYDWEIDLKNMTDGGDGGETTLGSNISEEHKLKISIANKGRKRFDLSESNKTAKSKKVHQIDFDTKEIINTFNSVNEASQITGCSKTNISKFANGNIKSTIKKVGGYEWRYSDRV